MELKGEMLRICKSKSGVMETYINIIENYSESSTRGIFQLISYVFRTSFKF